eukprot:TRINITY_DN76672_c0_g1_i1.p1 TRINITY_DN76672_c0_g1~~TRINITY_DN76672_c0_g1_i1.p1  ORF type:complete len:304 (-),score=39.97 TRINITY_DN76672_c0_g1_i1:80-991(-)
MPTKNSKKKKAPPTANKPKRPPPAPIPRLFLLPLDVAAVLLQFATTKELKPLSLVSTRMYNWLHYTSPKYIVPTGYTKPQAILSPFFPPSSSSDCSSSLTDHRDALSKSSTSEQLHTLLPSNFQVGHNSTNDHLLDSSSPSKRLRLLPIAVVKYQRSIFGAGLTPAQIDDVMKVFQWLKDHELQTEPTDEVGRTPLHWAAIHKDTPLCLRLLRFGLSGTKHRDRAKRLPIHYAAREGLTSVCLMMLRHDGIASMSAKDVCGHTPLELAKRHHGETAKKVLAQTEALLAQEEERWAMEDEFPLQ